MEDIVDFRTEGTFQGQDYIVIVKSFNEQLSIHLESKYEPVWWNNTFTASYLEELTQKTGIRRKFNEFVEAIVTGLAKRTEASNVDILTFQDLENMRNGTPTNASSSSSSQSGSKNPILTSSSSSGLGSASKKSSNNKRYIIVTTEVNGEKVHYPLSLNLDDIDNVDVLRQQIRKMKLEVEELKEKSIRGFSEMDGAQSSKGSFSTSKGNIHIMPGGFFLTDNNNNTQHLDRKNSTQNSLNTTQQSQVDQLKSENEMLKTKIKRIEDSSSQKRGAVEMDNIVKTKFELEEELELIRKESQQQIERLKITLEEKEDELIKNRTQFLTFQKEISQSQTSLLKGGPESEESTRRLRDFIVKLTEQTEVEVFNSRKVIQKQTKEIEKSASEIDFFKQNDRKQKNRIKQLEIELESAIKRVSTKGTTDRLYSPYTKNTPGSSGSSASNRRATSVPAKGYSPANRTTPTSTTNAQNRIGSRNASNSAGQRSGISPSYQFNAKKTPATTSATQIQNRSPGLSSGNRFGAGTNAQGANYRRNSPSSGTTSTTNTNRYGVNNASNSTGQNNSRNRYGGSASGIGGITGTATGTTNPTQRQFGTNKTNNAATTNRLANANKGLSPKPNTTSVTNTNRLSPSNSNRLGNNNTNNTLQRTNSNSRLSPASRYNLNNNTSSRTGTYGTNATNRQSPGTRVNNYLSANDQKLMKKIDDMQNSNKNNQANSGSSLGNYNNNNVSKEINDFKGDSNNNRIEEIDSRLNKLQNLLKMAKN